MSGNDVKLNKNIFFEKIFWPLTIKGAGEDTGHQMENSINFFILF